MPCSSCGRSGGASAGARSAFSLGPRRTRPQMYAVVIAGAVRKVTAEQLAWLQKHAR